MKKKMQQIFETKYEQKQWPGGLTDGTRSGFGSTMSSTEKIRSFLPKTFSELKISSLLDAPCGDYHWIRHVKFPRDFRYIGGDIAANVIVNLQENISKPNTKFIHFDILESRFPKVDAWLCRDCLQHLPLGHGIKALQNFGRSEINYVYLTHHDDIKSNAEAKVGGFAPRNLRLAPFNFPMPLLSSIDGQVGVGRFPRKIAIWSRKQINEAIGDGQ